ncbi:MAG TPA: sugar phosphate nucleotidyltransferase [Candidatus Saccharimonadales bacterium]|nr:sugar phosphate nucleotidyltransferase [Candidatus Saccharimonadales bacterium]
MAKVRKAVIAAAGFGTRFLPQTKAMPKEMLPIIDKPIIQYIVEELVEAGIEDIIIVTGYHKRSIEDHFDQMSADLRENLIQGGKNELLERTKKISELANFAYIRQKGPYGSATPILNAQSLIGDEPFIYTYADELIETSSNRFSQMIELYNRLGGSILPCINISSEEEFKRYGVVKGTQQEDGIMKIDGLVEKPGKANAPSDFASVGGYLLTPDVFEYAKKAIGGLGKKDEFYLTTYVLEPMINDGKNLYGCKLSGSKYYDTGNQLEYLKTVIDFALKRDDISQEVLEHIRNKIND